MDAGFTILLLLFVSVPLLNVSWFVAELIRSIRFSRNQSRSEALLMPLIAVFFFVESIIIDLYIASHAKM